MNRVISPFEVSCEDEADGQAGMQGAGAQPGGDIRDMAAAQEGDGERPKAAPGVTRPDRVPGIAWHAVTDLK